MVTRERVILGARLLTAIERESKRRNSQSLFSSVEREIISRELAELETEWSTNDRTGVSCAPHPRPIVRARRTTIPGSACVKGVLL